MTMFTSAESFQSCLKIVRYSDEIPQIHFYKVLLSFISEHKFWGSKQKFCQHLTGLIENNASENDFELISLDMGVRGKNLYEELKRGSLPYSGFINSNNDSDLINFGLYESIKPKFQDSSPQLPPENFELIRDLSHLENILGIKLTFYTLMQQMNDEDISSANKLTETLCRTNQRPVLLKILDTLQYQTLSVFQNAINFEHYEILISQMSKTDKICFDVIIAGSLNYSCLYDEKRFIAEIKFLKPTFPIIYDFKNHQTCHVDGFRKNFLERLLAQQESGHLSKFQDSNKQVQHICQDVNNWCFNFSGLQFLMQDFFHSFPCSILFLVTEGMDWFTKDKKLIKMKQYTKLPTAKYYTYRVLFRFNPLRKERQDLAEYEMICRNPAKFVVIFCNDILYLVPQKTRLEILKYCLQEDLKEKKTGSGSTTSSTRNDGYNEIKEFIDNLKANQNREQENLLGQTCFSSKKAKAEYTERASKLKNTLGEDFQNHCTICSDLPKITRHVEVGKRSKLYTTPRTAKCLMTEMGLNSEVNEKSIEECLSLSCASFDCETIGLPTNETQDNNPHRKYNVKSKTFSQFGIKNDNEPVNPNTTAFIIQKLVMIGVMDTYLDSLGENELPYVFHWPETLHEQEQLAQLYAVESFLVFLMKRQIFLFNQKFKILENLFVFILQYQEKMFEVFLRDRKLTYQDIFPCHNLEEIFSHRGNEGVRLEEGKFKPGDLSLLSDWETVFFSAPNDTLNNMYNKWLNNLAVSGEEIQNKASEIINRNIYNSEENFENVKNDGSHKNDSLESDNSNSDSTSSINYKKKKKKKKKSKPDNPYIVTECEYSQDDDDDDNEDGEDFEDVFDSFINDKTLARSDSSNSDDSSSPPNKRMRTNSPSFFRSLDNDQENISFCQTNDQSTDMLSADSKVITQSVCDHPVIAARDHIFELRKFWFASIFGQLQLSLIKICCKYIIYGFNMEVKKY